ncbi:MAG: VOC family protein [Anaerolineaceae bacterium]|nr:MAG: VOC family protein [Anaerolineaceae bacterium]
MNKIVPSLWFDTQCEEAMNHYVDTFNGAPNKKEESKIISITRYEKGMEAPGAEQMIGKVITGIFELAGQRYMALDGGPVFNFTEAISFFVECEDQKEVDYFWSRLSAVSEAEQCGWCKDKFGLSWQIVPKQLGELMGTSDPAKSMRVVNAMLKMKKIIVADLQKAHDEG